MNVLSTTSLGTDSPKNTVSGLRIPPQLGQSNILKDLKYYSSLLKSEKDRNSFSPLIKSINRILSEKRKEDLYSDQFNAAYPGYLEYLTRTYPDLTTADLKLCTFLRMNLNTKEIAEIMGLSVRSVESRRYRLRKKLNLSKEEDLVSNLISIMILYYLLRVFNSMTL